MNTARLRNLLQAFRFEALFNELGWDNVASSANLTVSADGQTYLLTAAAQKRGMVAFVCAADSAGRIPPYRTRRKIEQQVAKSVYEHIIVYVDASHQGQVWQWVRREKGKPTVSRETPYYAGTSGDLLLQKLQVIAVALEEEEELTLTVQTGRARQAFDVESVTKRFYDRFKAEHARFLTAVQPAALPLEDRQWYTSVMLNRLMFLYFIQKKGFLANDTDYLQRRLKTVRETHGADKFFTFYRHFLLRLFHEGLGQPTPHIPELEALIGNVPYLNGGLFAEHAVERRCREQGIVIGIEDAAFARLFTFFDDFDWHLDNRANKQGNEINPDVLGYIFEKYINYNEAGQKENGAYYTKEDITEYISRSTILPYLLDTAREKCGIAFEDEGSVWRLLRDNPDRFLFPALKHGMECPLPPHIEAGVKDVTRRGDWNKPAPASHALPTEIWREVVARRARCQELRDRLAAGKIESVNDLVTYNLDIRLFVAVIITEYEGADLIQALWRAIKNVRVLDPTVGSGAFLFAALNILEPLYELCLERMESFVGDVDRANEAISGTQFRPFREELAHVNSPKHPNRPYFIFKSIIVNNLFGVDIMEEATEICKLRLFLKLVAQVEPNFAKPNMGVEPLPDVDFNIRAGNTLVGYVNEADMDRLWTATGQLPYDRDPDLAMKVKAYSEKLADFRKQQLGLPTPFVETKEDVERAANEVRPGLNNDLWHLYRTTKKLDPKVTQKQFLASHTPLHWFIEFPEVMAHGGFDVIIGNPPWKEYSATKKSYNILGYETEVCGNLYALCTERIASMRSKAGRVSFIVQLPITSSSRMDVLRRILRRNDVLYVIPFDDRPGKLFEGLQHSRSAIFMAKGCPVSQTATLLTTRYQRWYSNTRDNLTQLFTYTKNTVQGIHTSQFPKCAGILQDSIFTRVIATSTKTMMHFLSEQPTEQFVFYQEATQYWVKATHGLPYYSKNGIVSAPAHGRYMYFTSAQTAKAACALLNSNLFYLYFIAYGDCFHLSQGLATTFPMTDDILAASDLSQATDKLMASLKTTADRKTINTKGGDEISYDEYSGSKCKPNIDEIDRLLARHYGFTDEELDFIINYDIKYRMGRAGEEDDE